MDAILEVMNQQLAGFDGHDLLSVVQTWVPTTSADPTMMGIKGKRPQFSMDNNVEDFLQRATDWMSQRGTPFYAFITQNLKDYLDTSLPPADYAKREARFLSHIKTAFKAAGPLVLLDSGLLGDTHDLSVGQDDRVIVSALPFGKDAPVYGLLHSFLVEEFAREGVGLLAFGRVHLVARDRDGAGRDRLGAVVEKGMARAAAMPDLKKNPPALGVNGVSDPAPTRDLGLIVNSRLGVEGRVALHRHRRLRDDQPRRGALGVVFRHERSRHMPGLRAAAGERSHEDSVGQFQRAEAEFFKKRSGIPHD
jgi:hypothetical protein